MEKLGLVGRLMMGGEIAGFFVVSESGKESLLSKPRVIALAEKGVIQNWEVVTDESGEKLLYSENNSLSSLPSKIKETDTGITVVGKIFKSGEHVGFVCIDSEGVHKNYRVDAFWNLVKQGRVYGVKSEKFKGSRILISEGRNLDTLEIVNISK